MHIIKYPFTIYPFLDAQMTGAASIELPNTEQLQVGGAFAGLLLARRSQNRRTG
jgi:hypothetical protein